MKEQIQKVNIPYLLAYIFVPIIICALCYWLYADFFTEGGTGAVLTTMVPTIAAFLWWVAGGNFLFKRHTKAFEKKFAESGYKASQIFYGKGKTVALDTHKGTLGLVLFWNPQQEYILPASRIKKAWVDDGRSGSGILEGSSRVSFLFTIDDDITVRVNTFTSNQRWRMTDNYIKTGIAKAETMVKQIEEAKKNAKK